MRRFLALGFAAVAAACGGNGGGGAGAPDVAPDHVADGAPEFAADAMPEVAPDPSPDPAGDLEEADAATGQDASDEAPDEAGDEAGDGTAAGDEGTAAGLPKATGVTVPDPAHGIVKVTFSLKDPDSDACDVAIEIDAGDGKGFRPATTWKGGEGTTGLASTPAGTVHEVAWNTHADLGKRVVEGVILRVTPSDADGTGQPASTAPFTVSNPLGFADATAERLPALTGDTRYVGHGDADGDGDTDLFLAVAAGDNLLLRQGADGTFEAEVLPGGMGTHSCLVPFDLDGDGDLDLFVCDGDKPEKVLVNDGAGIFADATATALDAPDSQAERALVADLDLDGDTDVVLVCSGTQQTRLLLNEGGVLVDATAGRMPEATLMGSGGSLGSVDGNGPPDLVFACFVSSQTTRLWRNVGSALFVEASGDLGIPFESMGFDAVLADFDGDGDLDLFEANLWNVQRVLRNDGAGKFSKVSGALPSNAGPNGDGTFFAVDAEPGDVDLDGDTDVLLVCSTNTPVSNREVLLLNAGNATFQPWENDAFPQAGGDSRHAALVDVDGDGDLDAVVANAYSQTALYLNL